LSLYILGLETGQDISSPSAVRGESVGKVRLISLGAAYGNSERPQHDAHAFCCCESLQASPCASRGAGFRADTVGATNYESSLPHSSPVVVKSWPFTAFVRSCVRVPDRAGLWAPRDNSHVLPRSLITNIEVRIIDVTGTRAPTPRSSSQ
jgi:hypothetical protein